MQSIFFNKKLFNEKLASAGFTCVSWNVQTRIENTDVTVNAYIFLTATVTTADEGERLLAWLKAIPIHPDIYIHVRPGMSLLYPIYQ